MIIVGELINSSRKVIAEAISAQDAETIQKVASDQFIAGAEYIDVNAGTFAEQETQHLTWLTETVQSAIDAPCALDSPDPKALEAALKVHRGTAMINSISLEKKRFDSLLPLIVTTWPGIHTMCGLSNISYGLPGRKFLNRTFMVMAITKGLDGAIINPLDKKMKAAIIAAEALAGRDNYCMNFLKAFRAGELG